MEGETRKTVDVVSFFSWRFVEMSQPEAAFYHRTVGSNGYWTSYLNPDLEVLDHPSPEGLEDDFTIGRFSLCNFGMTLEQDSALLSPVTLCINSSVWNLRSKREPLSRQTWQGLQKAFLQKFQN